jgi:hypothetical protein
MDQLLLNRLIFWVICLIFLLVLMYIKKFPKFSMQEKIFTLFILIFILQVVVRTTLLLVHYDLAIGTTKGIHYSRKGNFASIAYEFRYNNKKYIRRDFYKRGVEKQNGRYYVRVAKNFPLINEMDFSMQVLRNKHTIR